MFLTRLFSKRSRSITGSERSERVLKFSESFRLAAKSKLRSGNIESITNVSPSVLEVVIRVSEQDSKDFFFYAGQWLSIFSGPDCLERAEFSICSAPNLLLEKGLVALIVGIPSDITSLTTENPLVRFLCTEAKDGDEILFKGPGGNAYYIEPQFPNQPVAPIVLIGGGTGLSPLFSILRHICSREDSRKIKTPIKLIISAKSLRQIPYKTELTNLIKQNEHITVHCTITSNSAMHLSSSISVMITEPDTYKTIWSGWKGRLDQAKFNSLTIDYHSSLFFLCGPPGLVDTVQVILEREGVTPDQIKFDKWW